MRVVVGSGLLKRRGLIVDTTFLYSMVPCVCGVGNMLRAFFAAPAKACLLTVLEAQFGFQRAGSQFQEELCGHCAKQLQADNACLIELEKTHEPSKVASVHCPGFGVSMLWVNIPTSSHKTGCLMEVRVPIIHSLRDPGTKHHPFVTPGKHRC